MRSLLLLLAICATLQTGAQYRVSIIGSSTAAGQGATTYDSSWAGRFNGYYHRDLGIVDSVQNLGVGGYTVYRGMPTSFTPPAGRPAPDPGSNVTKALQFLAGYGRNAAVIVSFPTNGYDNYTIPEILARLQTIYDSAIAAGQRCFITTTQPRSDGNFATSAVKARLAALKDSIINRFGIAHTLNFWDGIYNPADSSILPAYSAGDNVHLNNAGHRELFRRVLAKNIFDANPPRTGDYRSNVAPTGLWSAAASWEVFNGSTWVTATAAPDSGSGVIRILNGDSIRVNSATTLDQVVVDTGAVLTFFNTTAPTTFTLTNAPGEDLLVYGRLYVSTGATLSGGGELALTPNSLFTLRNFGTLAVNTRSEGLARTTGTGVISAATFINSGVFQHVEFTLNLNNGATFVNNDSLALIYASDSYFSASAGSGSLINAVGGVIYKSQSSGIAYVNASVAFSNYGAVKGTGQYIIQNIGSNTGILAPGTSPGWTAINPGFFNTKAPVLRMEISGSGAIGGVTYDSLRLTSVNTTVTSLSGTRLELSNTGTDPVNTVYTIISSAGTITGTFASVSLPSNFGNLSYNGSTVTVQKIAANPLSLLLLRFGTRLAGTRALLDWELAKPLAGGRINVERSEDGAAFMPVAEIACNPDQVSFRYEEQRPGNTALYFYRLQVLESDGEAAYSPVRSLRFPGASVILASGPNPVDGSFRLRLSEAAHCQLIDAAGRKVRSMHLSAGEQRMELGELAPGLYRLQLVLPDGRTETIPVQRR